jgi:oxygen tolerance protein BatD
VLLVLLAAGASELIGFADWLHAQVSVQSDYVFVGEPFTVRIRVLGTVVPRRPDTSAVKDFAIEFDRKEWNSSRGDTAFIYRFRAKRAGVLHVPPIPVSGGGTTTRTPRMTVRARSVEETEAVLTVELSTRDCYVGQRVFGDLVLRFRGDGRSYAFDVPFLHDERFVAVLPTHGFVSHPPDGQIRVRVNRMHAVAQFAQDGAGDDATNTVRLPMILIPQQAGLIELAEVGAQTRIQRAKRRKPENLFVQAAATTLAVRPLPEDGRPHDFSGLVGRYRLQAAVDLSSIRVGDPVTLTLTLSGEPYLSDASFPDMLSKAGLQDDFQTSIGAPESTSRETAKDFHYTLRPRSTTVRKIPEITYNYFDPIARRYVTARTNPVPLRVAANRVLRASDAEGAAAASSPRVVVPQDLLAGIAHNFDGPGVLTMQRLGLAALFASPVRTGAIAIPPAAFLMLLLSSWLARWRDRRRRLHLTPRQEFDRSSHDVPALRRYLAGVAGLKPGSATLADVRRSPCFSRLSRETLDGLSAVLDAEDAERFGGAAARETPDIGSLVRRIEAELGR